MSRELERRIVALERVKNGHGGVRYVVLDYPPEDDECEPFELRRPLSEAEWVAKHCFD